jgi:type I restriction enzyme S subunit
MTPTASQTPQPRAEKVASEFELPQGWTDTNLENCATLITKGSTPTSYGFKYKSSGISFVRVENLADGFIDRSSISTFIDSDADEALKRSRLKAGDLLFSIAGTIGRTALVTADDLPANTNQALAVIRGTGKVFSPQFLRFSLASLLAQQQARSDARGGGMNNISLEDVRSLRLPVPPFAEQIRIVARVEDLLARVDAACARLAKVTQILKRFRQAVLASACSGRLTEDWRKENPNVERATHLVIRVRDSRSRTRNRTGSAARAKVEELFNLPSSWAWVFFGAVCDDITVGHVGPMANEYREAGIPFLRSQNVREFHFDPAGLKFIGRDFHEKLHKSALHSGDVVVVRSGFAGVACVIPNDLREANCADLVVIRPSSALNPHYACIFVNSNAGRAHVDEVKVGIAQSHFNIGSARTTPFPLPPILEQGEIVRRVEVLFKLADDIEKRVEVATKRANKLSQAILAKAFRGGLVPTEAELARSEGREYEPASSLLERIREERRDKSEGKTNAGTRHKISHL